MSKAKFVAAKELIDEKHYDVARSVLNTIDDPQATKWLAKLDSIAPDKSKSARRRTFLILWSLSVLAVLSVAGALFLVNGSRDPFPTKADSMQRIFNAYCALMENNVVKDPRCDYNTFAEISQDEDIQTCFVASLEGESIEVFTSCMIANLMGLGDMVIPTMQLVIPLITPTP